MKLSDLKLWFYYFPLRIACSRLPVAAIAAVGSWAARFEELTVRSQNLECLHRNIAGVLGLQPGAEQVRAVGRQVLRNYLWNILEYCLAHRLRRLYGSDYLRIDGAEELRKAVVAGNGVVIVSGHYANFEMVPTAPAWEGYDTVLIEPADTSAASMPAGPRRRIQQFRKAHQQHHLKYRTVYTGVSFRHAIDFLRQGGVVIIAADYPATSGQTVSFLGQEMAAPQGPAHLALKSGARVFFGGYERLSFGRNRLFLQSVAVPDSGNFKDDRWQLTLTLVSLCEQWILERPGQWAWLLWAKNDLVFRS